MIDKRFEHLFQPGGIGKLRIKNRIVMAPMGTMYTEDGRVDRRMIAFHEARARGGVGLIIVEGTCVESQLGRIVPPQPCIDSDSYVPEWAALVQTIHAYGTKAAIQLAHGGAVAKPRKPGNPVLAPSAISTPGREAREMTVGEIRDIVGTFVEAALRAKKAGFDAVEIHGAHRYLLAQFLSGVTNRRTDAYGGSLPNRARLLIEVIEAVRSAVGPDFPIFCRLNGRDFGIEGGISLGETQQTARMAEKAGADAIHVSGWGVNSLVQVASLPVNKGVLVPLAAAVKSSVRVPVIAVGRISPRMGESILAQGKADFIAMGRALIADPDIPNKVAAGRVEDINPCIACMACRDDIIAGGDLRCAVNPAVGKEDDFRLKAADKKKSVLVVGGGPAGLEAARVAALRGHRVELWEKEEHLGGQLLEATIPPHKSRIKPLISYLARQVDKAGVEVKTGTKATLAKVQRAKPDAVVLATGVRPFLPEISGVSLTIVTTADEVLRGKSTVGDRVVVIGGELVGCETAEFLAAKGKSVTITRRGSAMAQGVNASIRGLLLARLARAGVKMLTGVKYHGITSSGLTITASDGKKALIKADTIVLAAGANGNQELARALQGKVKEVHMVGDCVQPRSIREAITDGSRVGRAL